ncbi:putative enzyme involved in methoxymalonyl-ACP biosynthesis [Nitrospirillum viridazoti Y2]|uniref:HAD superfamily phosphatase (TIGR01681 family)/FkbH-like protein n=1 Tax=Nitrospirillum amazonense TaxID=28077 RepID=A0A560IEV7_9PROT|nr:HAD-IIIC family phosphatase [Nitrospirillum amazonense]EGY01071.1 putative enzyme involved in methoxymalonyl-ACP biosynthesis [Nitrospirillum amazonense Y2]TWB56661.1 HAD superfamily phosphatase (TIGR01681 family)/FkbH-like protein [Nitrospirillum amazonense]
MVSLNWLPLDAGWQAQLKQLEATPQADWASFAHLARQNLDFIRTDRLDRALGKSNVEPPAGITPVRLAVLGSSTQAHLQGAIRVAGVRHNLHIRIYQGEYGQYVQDLLAPPAELREFQPNYLLLAMDAAHAIGGLKVDMDAGGVADLRRAFVERLRQCWRGAQALGARVIQQTILPSALPLLGQNDHLLPGSPAAFIAALNYDLRAAATEEGVIVLALDQEAARHGIDAFHDAVMWHRAKQDVKPGVAPYYGDLVARLMAAAAGRSAKCLILDLDNTLWGGVVGDDGVEGIALGQGSAEGEAFAAIQAYAKALSQRGIALAVCSKNDEMNAKAPFERSPEMVLRLPDIACFVANWQNKADNIRQIAERLNLGLDAMVFLDDNPAERALVRAELPMVRIIEMAEEPALVPAMLAACGWFESVSVTAEDFTRSAQYTANAARDALRENATDLDGYLASLNMRLLWREFDTLGHARIVQLINKTNQFNLTTRRYGDADVTALIDASDGKGLQFRLLDTFGDNGMIGVVIIRATDTPGTWEIDTWLMSCRVLGRRAEQAMLNVVVDFARSLGVEQLIGRFIPSGRNDMVREHYAKLGFTRFDTAENDGQLQYILTLPEFSPESTQISIEVG